MASNSMYFVVLAVAAVALANIDNDGDRVVHFPEILAKAWKL